MLGYRLTGIILLLLVCVPLHVQSDHSVCLRYCDAKVPILQRVGEYICVK